MTRSEQAFLSQAHAVAMTAVAAADSRVAPDRKAAFALPQAAAVDLPGLVPACNRFVEDIRASHGHLDRVAAAGRAFRDSVLLAMSFVPHDIGRVDIHG